MIAHVWFAAWLVTIETYWPPGDGKGVLDGEEPGEVEYEIVAETDAVGVAVWLRVGNVEDDNDTVSEADAVREEELLANEVPEATGELDGEVSTEGGAFSCPEDDPN